MLPVWGVRGITSLCVMMGEDAKVRIHVKRLLFSSITLKGLHFCCRDVKNPQLFSELKLKMCQALNKSKI